MPASGDIVLTSHVVTRVATQPLVADSATWNATESGALISVTATLVSGWIYGIWLTTNVSTDVAADVAQIRIREDTAAGTQLIGPMIPMPTTNASGFPLAVYTEYTAVASAAKTFVVTGQRNTGTGTAHRLRAGTSRPSYLTVTTILA